MPAVIGKAVVHLVTPDMPSTTFFYLPILLHHEALDIFNYSWFATNPDSHLSITRAADDDRSAAEEVAARPRPSGPSPSNPKYSVGILVSSLS